MLLMRGNLHHAVSRGVEDRFSCADVLLTQFLDNDRAAGMTVTEPAGRSAASISRSIRSRGNRVPVFREIPPIKGNRDASRSQCPLGVSLPLLISDA